MKNNNIKIGLIGFGSIGKRHYENLTARGERVVVFSNRNSIKVSHQARNWKDFSSQGPYGAIFVTNETHKHIPTIKKAIALNPKAIFIEKPLAPDFKPKELNALLESLKKKKISAWVGYCLHFFRPLLEVKKLLQKNAIGRIYYMRVSYGNDLRSWRKRDYRLNYSAKKSQGGGIMLDAIHDLNYPAWLLEDELRPLAGAIKKISSLQIDTEDYAESILVSKKKKVLVSVHQDYLRIPGKRSLEIAGEKGTIVWDSLRGEISIETSNKIIRKKVPVERNEMYEKELDFFLKAVKKGKLFSNLREAMRDLEIIKILKK